MKTIATCFLLLSSLGCRNAQQETTGTVLADTPVIKKETDGQAIPADTPVPVSKEKEAAAGEISDINEEFIQRAIITRSDSAINVYQNIRADYRIFGYSAPDTNSRKMILISVFTNDVEGNPYQCPYGAYYYSGGIPDTELKYTGQTAAFIRASLVKEGADPVTIYIQKEWTEFED
jgi:hypothetical protein